MKQDNKEDEVDISEEDAEITCQCGDDESYKEDDGCRLHSSIHFLREFGKPHANEHANDYRYAENQEYGAEHLYRVDGDGHQQG